MKIFRSQKFMKAMQKHPKAKKPLESFVTMVKAANWSSTDDVIKTALFDPHPLGCTGRIRVKFEIGGNKYRLICEMDFERQAVRPVWFGTHAKYDRLMPPSQKCQSRNL